MESKTARTSAFSNSPVLFVSPAGDLGPAWLAAVVFF